MRSALSLAGGNFCKSNPPVNSDTSHRAAPAANTLRALKASIKSGSLEVIWNSNHSKPQALRTDIADPDS